MGLAPLRPVRQPWVGGAQPAVPISAIEARSRWVTPPMLRPRAGGSGLTMEDRRIDRPGGSRRTAPRIAGACLLAWALCVAHPAAAESEDPVLATVGDIACAPGAEGKPCQHLATANLTSSVQPSAVAVLGDSQYDSALRREYNGRGAY